MRLKLILVLTVACASVAAMAQDILVYHFDAKRVQEMRVGDQLLINLQCRPSARLMWVEKAGGHPGLRFVAMRSLPPLKGKLGGAQEQQIKFVAIKAGLQNLVLELRNAGGGKPIETKTAVVKVMR